MRYTFLSALLLTLLSLGCRTADFTYDNPRVRSFQADTLTNGVNEVAGQSLTKFFGPRTGWVLHEEAAILQSEPVSGGQTISVGGRAAAVAEDGYYLTAYHVVEEGSPVMILPPNSTFKSGRIAKVGNQDVMLSPGRIVKHFDKMDLALVKFEHRPRRHFDQFQENPTKGTEVFSACVDGYLLGKDKIGNGPFKVRGEITGSKPTKRKAAGTTVTSTIVARGGMSGAPIADGEGRLVGILTAGTWSRFTQRPLSSESEMIPHSQLLEIINKDRESL